MLNILSSAFLPLFQRIQPGYFLPSDTQNDSSADKEKADELGNGKAQEGSRTGENISPSRTATEIFDGETDNPVVDEKERSDLAFEAPSSKNQQ